MTHEQRGVLKGALPAFTLTMLTLIGAHYLASKGVAVHMQLATALGIISLPLLYCIGYIANKRFYDEHLIVGSAHDAPGSMLAIDKAILQNTLEQTVLAFGAYTFFTSTLPDYSLFLFPVFVSLFIFGRICFIVGYTYGAHGRAFGFGLTFYPTVLMLMYTLVYTFVT